MKQQATDMTNVNTKELENNPTNQASEQNMDNDAESVEVDLSFLGGKFSFKGNGKYLAIFAVIIGILVIAYLIQNTLN